ncbi:relaxase/mobilization nuclease domain-containing protein [Actinomadura craniellae]|uniref:relaxase/mobilization nuclease domain-containing protein n=1 Tax=Actinomadura craniellae TaxID=2231787 RepID=UPI0011BDAE2A|nr:hypothetical protein [Actinomadura craniellae]
MTRGTKVAGLLYYLYGPGKANEHRDPHLIAGWRDPAELEPPLRPNGTRDFRYLGGLLDRTVTALGPHNHVKPVWQCSIRAAPDDPILTDAQWADIAHRVMDRVGLAPAGDDEAVRWIAVRHAADHIHLVATLARQDGTRPEIWNDFYKVADACRTIERHYGLRAAPPCDRTAARPPGRAETEKARRHRRDEAPRTTLRRHVSTAAAGARSEAEFFDRLAAGGVRVRKRFSDRRPDEATGYAVALLDDATASGEPVWYGGGKLAADLSLPRLRARWSKPSEAGGPVSGRWLSARTARAALRQSVADAADRSRNETEFFTRLEEAGLRVRKRFSELHPGEITGYAVTLPEYTGSDGAPLWHSGGSLSDRLTLPRLRQRWQTPEAPADDRLTLTFEERQALYDDAARAAAHATEHIRRYGRFDPARAADAAWATSDVLHSAARSLGNRELSRAADAYDRAAREPFARIPTPTPAGDALRTIARVFALVPGEAARDGRTLLLFIANLVTLIEAVAELRDIQRRPVQVGAAATARGRVSGRNTALETRQEQPADRDGELNEIARFISSEFPTPIFEATQKPTAGSSERDATSPVRRHPRGPQR